MRIFYKCDCMTAEVGIELRERSDHEDVGAWAREIKQALAADHDKRSPRCVRASTLLLRGHMMSE